MAQVKKLSTGGIVYNGKTYTSDDLQKLITTSVPIEYTNFLLKLKSGVDKGETYYYDGNKLSGNNLAETFFDGNEKELKKVSKERTRVGRNWDATVGNERDSIKRAVSYLSLLSKSDESSSSNNSQKLPELERGKDWFEYNKDKKWIEGPSNSGKLGIIDSIFEEIGNKGRYSTKQNWASNQTDLSDLYAWANGKDLSSFRNSLKSHLLNGEELTDEELSVLRSMGFSKPDISAESNDVDKILDKWEEKGYNDADSKFLSEHFIINDDGTITVNDPELVGNHWWNDNWKESNYYDYKFNPLYGHILYNGQLYRESELNNPDSILYKEVHNPNQFYYLNSIGDYAAANQRLNYLWDPNFENAGILPKDHYAKGLSDKKGRRFKVLNGLYEGLEDGQQLIQYFDMSPENMLSNGSGAYQNKFALLDSKGNVIDEDYDITDLVRIANGEAQPILAPEIINRDRNSVYNGMIQDREYTNDNGTTGLSIYEDPTGESDRMIISYPGSKRGNFVISGELAAILRKHPEFLNEIASNSDLQAKFKRTIDSIGNRNFTGNSGYGLKPITNAIMGPILRKKDLQALGEDADRFLELIKEIALSGKGLDRRAKYFTTENPIKEQNGGTIDWLKIGGLVPKMQNGSSFVKNAGSSKNVKASSNEKKVQKTASYADPGAAFDGKLSQEEVWEIGGLIADLTSLGLTIAGTGNPVAFAAAGAGAAGSLTTFRNDVVRDGLQGKDVLGLAGNLVLDASSLLPVVGSVAKGANITKKIVKAAPTLLKLGAVYGLGAGFTDIVKKAVNGENLTFRDLRQIINILTGTAVLKKTGMGSGKVKGTPVESNFNFKLKSGDTTVDSSIKLSNDEIKQIKDIKDSSKQINKIKEIIISKKPGTKAEDIQLNTEKVKEQIKLLKPKTFFKRNEVEKAVGIPDKSKPNKQFVWDENAKDNTWFNGRKNPVQQQRNAYLAGEAPNQTNKLVADFKFPIEISPNSRALVPTQGSLVPMKSITVPIKHDVFTTGNILPGQRIPQQEPSPYFVPFESVQDDYYHNYYPEYKNGGKVIKAREGLGLPNGPKIDYSKAYNGSAKVFQNIADDIAKNKDLWHFNIINNKPYLRRDSGNGETTWTPIEIPETELLPPTNFSVENKNSFNSVGGQYGTRPFVNIANLADFGELLRTYSASDLNTWLNKKANLENLGGLQVNEPEIYNRFSDYGESAAIRQNAAKLMNMPTVSSNAQISLAERLVRAEKVNELENEADRRFSQKLEAFQNQQAEIGRQYADKRNSITNTNRALTARINVNDKSLDAINASTKNAARQAFSQQYRQEIRDKMNRLIQLKTSQDLSDTQNRIQNAFNLEAQNYYNTSVDHDKYKTLAAWRDYDPNYLTWEDNTYRSIMNKLGYYGQAYDSIYDTSGIAKLAIGPRKLGAYENGGILELKTGGSSTYKKKSTQEVMAENAHKQSLKILSDTSKQLNKSVLELLSKLIK